MQMAKTKCRTKYKEWVEWVELMAGEKLLKSIVSKLANKKKCEK